MGENLVDRVKEAHIEHLVGFIKHHGVDVAQLDNSTVDEVDQSARVATMICDPSRRARIWLSIDDPP